MNIWNKLVTVITDPVYFYKKVKKDTIGSAYKYFVVLFLIAFGISSIANVITTGPEVLIMLTLYVVFVAPFAIGLYPLIGGALVHLGSVMMKGKGTFTQSLLTITYGFGVTIPYSILSIPVYMVTYRGVDPFGASLPNNPAFWTGYGIMMFIGVLSMIHHLAVTVIGVKEYHKLSTGKAIFASVIGPLLMFALLVMFIAFIAILVAVVA